MTGSTAKNASHRQSFLLFLPQLAAQFSSHGVLEHLGIQQEQGSSDGYARKCKLGASDESGLVPQQVA